MAKIAFIGLGNMGGPMAINLHKAGHELKVFDLSENAKDKALKAGLKVSENAIDSIVDVEFVITMLQNGDQVENLLFNEDQSLIKNLAKNITIIDSSTIDAETATRMSKRAKKLSINFLDAPVSGGVGGAVAGTLAFMVGGPEEQFLKAKPLLENMGKNIFHAGPSGAGQIAKACNNMLLAILMTGTAEALNMGMRNGMDPNVLSEIMKQSSGSNWALQVYNPVPGVMENVPAAKNYDGGFQVDLMLKDLGLAMDISQNNKSPVPMGAQAKALYELHRTKGNGTLDFSSILNLYSE